MFVSLLSFSLSEKSQAMFWWLWINLNICHWRTCASFVGPNSMKSDMLWQYFLTTERMVTLDSGNLAWRTWRVSETCICDGLLTRKKMSLLNICPNALGHLHSANNGGTMRDWQLYVVWEFYQYLILFLVNQKLFLELIKGCVWKSCQEPIWNKNSCWKSRWTFFLVLISWACCFPSDPCLLHMCCFRCCVFSTMLV